MATGTQPKTLREAILFFSDYENCKAAMIALRWPDGTVRCPRCGSDKVTYLANARVWKCYGAHPKAKFSLKVGTLFEDSALPLEKWFPALWLLVNCKNGISSYELGRALGVTQKTAWFMLSRLRFAIQDRFTGGKLGGDVEVDETFIGGKGRNMHADKKQRVGMQRGRSMSGKTAVMGLLDRHGKGGVSQVRTVVLTGRKKGTLQSQVRDHVKAGSNVYTDAFYSYRGLSRDYVHGFVDHAEAYVDGNIHTNGLENFWSLLKRTIKGTYVSNEPFHLFRYLDEQAFRFNNRETNDLGRFMLGLNGLLGRRLTYAALTDAEVERC